MNPAQLEQQQPLLSQIDGAQEQLGRLAEDLSAIDSELQGLAAQREQYDALAQACSSLQKLKALGAAQLFWGQSANDAQVEEHIQRAQQAIEEFQQRLAAASGTREGVAARIAEGRGVLAILEDDLFDLQEQEEERRNEWVIEREVSPTAERPTWMPWTRGGEDDRRFRKSLGSSLAAAVLLGLLLPLIDLPLPGPAEIIEVPERLVQLIRQAPRPVPPPPPPQIVEELPPDVPEPPPEVVPEPEPEERVAEQRPTEAATPTEAPAPQEPPRPSARSSGILAFRESFATLATNRPAARLGSDARINNAGDAAIGRPERSMITTQAPGSSGGINLAALSRDVGGGGGGGGAQIAGVETTRVESAIGPGGGGGGRGGGGVGGPGGSGGVAGRTDEEIQIVFDRYKASLYRLYNRELRNSPTLRGQMVLRLTIEPSGVVSMCELQSTDMDAAALVQQVLERVRTFDFGAKDVAPITIVYPIDFLPAA